MRIGRKAGVRVYSQHFNARSAGHFSHSDYGLENGLSNFFNKLWFKFHRTNTVYFAVNIMITVDQTDDFDFSADFDNWWWTFNFEVFDDGDGIAVLKHVAVCIFDDTDIGAVFGCPIFLPFVSAFRANVMTTVFVSEFWATSRAFRKITHCFFTLK